jgi:hypothetical protein
MMAGMHNERFALLQEKYLEARDSRLLGKMYGICVELAMNYIKKYARQRGLRLDAEEPAHDSAAYIIGRYIKDSSFKLEPLSGYLFLCCNSAMWRDKDWNKRTASFEDWMRPNGEAV